MCSICGISFQEKNTISNSNMVHEILQKLLVNCQIRGKSATGIAVASDKRIIVIKNNLSAERFVKTSEFKKVLKQCVCFNKKKGCIPPIQIIGHCRMPTKGSPLNNKNNHPIVTKSLVGVHNGVIFNDDELFDKYKDSFKRDGEVDSEIIFKLIEKYYIDCNDMPKTIQLANLKLSGGMTCALITIKNPHLLWLFRRGNPITILHYKKIGMIIFASDKKYITNAVKGMPIGSSSQISMQLEEGLGINLFNNTIHRFKTPRTPNSEFIGYV